jgi:hypothetical protein
MGEWKGGHMSECPAIRELRAALLAAAPLLTPAKLGTTRPDGSCHDAGLAMDIMLDSRKIDEKPQAVEFIDHRRGREAAPPNEMVRHPLHGLGWFTPRILLFMARRRLTT